MHLSDKNTAISPQAVIKLSKKDNDVTVSFLPKDTGSDPNPIAASWWSSSDGNEL